MKNTIVKIILAVSLSSVFVAGCSTNSSSSSFNLMSADSIVENQKVGAFENHMNGMGFKLLTKDLNLTQDQLTKIKAIKESGLKNVDANKTNRDAIKATLKEAFLADKVDKVALKDKLTKLMPTDDTRLDAMSKNIIDIYNILTPEQRVKAEEKIASFETNMEKLHKTFKGKSDKKDMKNMKGMKKDCGMMGMQGIPGVKSVGLTDAQKTEVDKVMTETAPNRDEMMTKMKTVRTSILAELKTGNPSVDKIKAILKESKGDMQSHLDKRLDTMIKIHDILTPEQRTKLAQDLENKAQKFEKKFKTKTTTSTVK